MRLANLDGRVTAIVNGGGLDVEKATAGEFGNDIFAAVECWAALAAAISTSDVAPTPIDDQLFGAPIPMPRQVFAIGLNYRDHAAEANLAIPEAPLVFTKFPACTTGPTAEVELPSGGVDYEVELVVVIGKKAEQVTRDRAWEHVAGYMVGQDLSERSVQLAGPAPQFSLGKSYPGFGPTGPVIVGLEEFADPDALALGCSIGDEVLQDGNTANLIFDVRDLIVRLSAVCALLPGDLIYTGTPAGVGMGRTPPRFLAPGETLTSYVETVGELRTSFIAGPKLPTTRR